MPSFSTPSSIPWATVIILAAIVLVLGLATWWYVRRRRARGAVAPPPASQPDVSGQIAEAWRRFYRDLPGRAAHFPTVIVMGDAGAGKSHLIDARVDWRSQANQFFPSALDSPHLQLYLGSDVVVHELSAPLLRDISRSARRALVQLWRHAGPSATVVVVVDARTLSTTPPETLRELAELVRGKIGALPARCRAGVEVRVCLSHMDQIDGYDELVAVIGAQHGALAIAPLGERVADAGALLAATRAMMAPHDPNLAYGLTTRGADAFARLVGFYATFPVLLARLAPLVRGLTGEDPDHPRYPPSGLYLGSVAPDIHVGDPFTVDRGLVATSITQQRRRHRRGALIAAMAGAALVGVMMWGHEARVSAAEAATAGYGEVAPGHTTGDAQARRAVAAIRRMQDGERLWLGQTFLERKREVHERLAHELRTRHLLPMLRVQQVNRSIMLYLVGLLYASADNGLRTLIRNNLTLWATKLDLSSTVVSAYLDVSDEQYRHLEAFDPQYTGGDWEGYVFERLQPVYDQPGRITQAQLDQLLLDLPQLYDEREYAVRRDVVELLSAQLALATHPPITKLLDSPLRSSAWVDSHIVALHGIHTTLEKSKIAPAAPRTLGELGGELVRLLSTPASGKLVHRLTEDRDGATRWFAFDVATWTHKLAQASAAVTIAHVRERNRTRPDQAIGFFTADATPRDIAPGGGAQGPSAGIPGAYTATAFTDHVAPALEFVTTQADKLALTDDERAALDEIYHAQVDDYAARYAGALRTYYQSFRFEPGGEDALPFALAGMMQPSSWFLRFLSTVSAQASPKLGEGVYYAAMADGLAEFRPLADLLVSAKGAIPGLAPYQQVITELATALDPSGPPIVVPVAAAAASAGDAGAAGATPATIASLLSRAGQITLNKLTGADKDRVAQVTGWLTGAGVSRGLHAPFLAPVEEADAFGGRSLQRAIGQAWTGELSPLLAPMLARFPFRTGARSDVTIAELEATLRAQGKQPGTFWSAFQRWLGPVTVLRGNRHTWLAGVTGPAGALTTINDLARLSRTLWDADGNPTALPIEITPQPLDASPAAGRVPTLAYLRSGAGAVYAFNQRPGPSTLALRWWEQGTSSIFVTMSKPGVVDVTTYSLDQPDSPFSFFRLLCRARAPSAYRPPETGEICPRGRGARVWDVPLDGAATRAVTLTLETDPWSVFHIGR